MPDELLIYLTFIAPQGACCQSMTGNTLLQSASSIKLCGVRARSRLFRPFRKHRSSPRRYSNSRTAHRCKASTGAQTDDRSEIQIEGIEQNYCDDFVCTSSPAVEQNLRALARDVVRTSTWTSDLFADEVRYTVSLQQVLRKSALYEPCM